MERKAWTLDIDGTEHRVELNWTYYGGHRQLLVDGEVVDDSTAFMRWRSEQAVTVAGHAVVVRTQPKARVSPFFVITLELDGRPVAPEPGKLAYWERAA